ncbi:MAG: CDP-diacylglycerol-glycerol-3-phosphate 3-phosphatidyltransferase [uncultured bacterium]|nr:MAG: CDP-diacylglycerol-glycerol-3-phosphate 3-phosphatidyltransferase [uncultured bacterium]
MNVPMMLTYTRIILIPAIVVAFYIPGKFGHVLATVIFALAAFTDWLDGFLARNLNQSTKLGAFLDPVADKLVVTTALILLVARMGVIYIAIPAAIIIGREIIISALREWMAEIGKHANVAVGMIAKIKTTMQMFAIGSLLLHCDAYGNKFLILGVCLLYMAVALTVWSMYIYIKIAWPDLTKEN